MQKPNWIKVKAPTYVEYLETAKPQRESHKQALKTFTFIDLFAGIGGFHLAAAENGGKCVMACEVDIAARKTYLQNHTTISNFPEDITTVKSDDVPNHDVLCAGFPCQPFSTAGFKKGFEDTRGTLFFEIARIIQAKKPKAIFLENVSHLLKHDNGKTFNTIKEVITNDLGYSFYYQIVKASDFGLPQNRPRLFMVGFRGDVKEAFSFPQPQELKMTMSDVFNGKCDKKIGYTLRVGGRGSGVLDRRNWDCYIVDGVEKQLTPKEGILMQGFPSSFVFPVSQTQSMKQLGNSVAIPAVSATIKEIIKFL